VSDFQLAFLRGSSPLAWAIRLRTGSRLTHVELVLPDRTSVTADFKDGVVRRPFVGGPQWAVVDVPGTVDRITLARVVDRVIDDELGAGYDWLGILLSQAVRANRQHPSKWFCSELVAYLLILSGSPLHRAAHQYSPASLWAALRLG
jgi:hypothetical protein